MICGGRYLSCDEAMRVFAAGEPNERMSIEVRWRSGKRSFVKSVKANRLYEIDEGGAIPSQTKPDFTPPPMFQDVSDQIRHLHHQEPYDDFARQPLLPHN